MSYELILLIVKKGVQGSRIRVVQDSMSDVWLLGLVVKRHCEQRNEVVAKNSPFGGYHD